MEPIKVVLCVKPRVYLGLILLVLGAIGATSEPAVAHDDSDLLCKGSIVTYLVNGQAPSRDQELAVHIESDKVNISGTSINSTNMQICMQAQDKISFYSRPCTEVSEAYVKGSSRCPRFVNI